MLQTHVQVSQAPADSSLQRGAVSRNTIVNIMRRPAVMLAFLLALAGIAGVAVARNTAITSSEVPAPASQQAAESEDINAAETQASVSAEAGAQNNSSNGNTNSVKIESVTNNGVTDTKLEVNGEEVPIKPNGTTNVTIDNGDQSVTNVTTQNTQIGGSGYNFNSSFSSSSSYSSNFQNGVGGD